MRRLLNWLQARRCARGHHAWQHSTSRMAAYCKREGCDGYWEYD